jgi:FAD/FMN-containing dehydrogenase
VRRGRTRRARPRSVAVGRVLDLVARLVDGVLDAALRAAYGPNGDRLAKVKRRYDPDNVFHVNHNITPAAQPA